MPKEQMWVEWKDGADLSQSRQKPGHRSPLTRDDQGNLGQVTLSDIEDNGSESIDNEPAWGMGYAADPGQRSASDETIEALGAIAAVVMLHLTGKAYDAAKPRVKRWWHDTARPTIGTAKKTAVNQISQTRKNVMRRRGYPATIPVTPRQTPIEAAAAIEAVRPSMSAQEAEQRLVAALIARAFSDAQIQMLLSSAIDGEAVSTAGLLENLPAHLIEQRVSRVIEANRSVHEELLSVFWREEPSGGSSLPVPVERLDGEPRSSPALRQGGQ